LRRGPLKRAYAADPRVARIDRLSSARWWALRGPSVRLARTAGDYEKQLDLVLRYSNSLMFIDPHLDPSKSRYGAFGALLQRAGKRTPGPRIEIHRACYDGSGPRRRLPMTGDPEYFRRVFRDALSRPLRDAGLCAEVFIWSDFHDRYTAQQPGSESRCRTVSTFRGARHHHDLDPTRTRRSRRRAARIRPRCRTARVGGPLRRAAIGVRRYRRFTGGARPASLRPRAPWHHRGSVRIVPGRRRRAPRRFR